MSLEGLAESIVRLRRAKGFYTPPAVKGFLSGKHRVRNAELMLAKLMLVSTEVAEAAEACRDEDIARFGVELADIIIRVLDIAGSCEIDIGRCVREALAAWINRPALHGRKIRL